MAESQAYERVMHRTGGSCRAKRLRPMQCRWDYARSADQTRTTTGLAVLDVIAILSLVFLRACIPACHRVSFAARRRALSPLLFDRACLPRAAPARRYDQSAKRIG